MELYITLKGDRRVDVTNREVTWTDKWGTHTGRVVEYGRTAEHGGTNVGSKRDVFKVACDDGEIRELKRHELRDLIEG